MLAPKKSLTAYGKQESQAPPPALPPEWTAALLEVFQSSDLDAGAAPAIRDKVPKQLIRSVATLRNKELLSHEAALEKLRSKMDFQLAAAEKKMRASRTAGSMEGNSLAAQLKAAQGAVAKLQDEVQTMEAEVSQVKAEAASSEQKLFKTMSQLDAGVAAAAKGRDAHATAVAEQAIRRMKNVGITKGFAAWKHMRYVRRTKMAFFKRMRELGMTRCFNSWVDTAEESARQKRMLAVAATRLLKPALAGRFVHWKDDWEAELLQSKTRGLLGRIADLEEALRQAIMDGDTKLKNAQEDARFTRIEAFARTTVRRMLNQQLGNAWNQWASVAYEIKRALAALARVVHRMRNKETARGWTAWEEFADEERRKKAAFNVCLRRMKNLEIFRAWSAWLEMAEEERRKKAAMSTFVGRLMNQEVAHAWGAWVEMVDEANRKKGMADGALRKFMNRDLARGWSAWVEMVDEANRKKAMADGALRRFMNGDLARGWSAWVEMAEEERRKKAAMSTFVGRLMNQEVAHAWGAWVEMVDEANRKKGMADGALRKFMNRDLARGWSAWVEMVDEANRKKAMADGALRRFMNGDLARGWSAWVDLMETAARQRELLAATAGRLRFPTMAASFAHWKDDWWKDIAYVAPSTDGLLQELAAAAEQLRVKEETIILQACTMDALKRELHEARVDRMELDRERKRAASSAAAVERLERVLKSVDAPLAIRERRALVKQLNVRLEELMETFQVQSTRRIRELAQIITLRERQFAASKAALLPRASSPSKNYEGKSLDVRPLMAAASDGWAVDPRTSASNKDTDGQLMIMPSFPEADELAQNVLAADELERAQILQDVREKVNADTIVDVYTSPREAPRHEEAPASWQSPYMLYKQQRLNPATMQPSISSPALRPLTLRTPRSMSRFPRVPSAAHQLPLVELRLMRARSYEGA